MEYRIIFLFFGERGGWAEGVKCMLQIACHSFTRTETTQTLAIIS